MLPAPQRHLYPAVRSIYLQLTHHKPPADESSAGGLPRKKPPLAVPRTVRGGGIFEENDGGDLPQISECSKICGVRIPSGASRQRPLEPKGSLWIVRIRIDFRFSQLPAATSQALRASSPERGAFFCLTRSARKPAAPLRADRSRGRWCRGVRGAGRPL